MPTLARMNLSQRLLGYADNDRTPCWIWPGALNSHGYGLSTAKFSDGRWRPVRVHRSAYQLLIGPIPHGMVLDHLCRNRACFNPWHLEPVTMTENTMRGDSPAARCARKTHCPQGHPLSGPNLYTLKCKDGRVIRYCRKCMRRHTDTWTRKRLASHQKVTLTPTNDLSR